jgi:hypothetical protein
MQRRALVRIGIAQPFSPDTRQSSVVFQLGLCDGDAAEQGLVVSVSMHSR